MLNVENLRSDPYLNMAIEEFLLTRLGEKDDCFMLWQNDPAIIIGRNQNAWSEINADFVHRRSIPVVRRLTGGGAVYHDQGNLNFTFVVRDQRAGFDFARFARPVIRALAELGVQAEASGRNDILIGGRKFSGNAEYRHDGRLLHHGTLLFGSDLTVLSQALQVRPQKIASKGISSVRSRVTNISEHLASGVTLAEFREVLLQAVAQDLGEQMHDYRLSSGEMKEVCELRDRKYATWDWNYGHAPEFNLQRDQRYPGGEVDVRLNIVHGRVAACYIYGDFFSNRDVASLAERLVGSPYSPDDLAAVLEDVDVSAYLPGLENSAFLQLLFNQAEEQESN